ncbi:hypothetical protein Tco_0725372 [Tanacetum coccineum]|uniref:Uncharacterized protein n=1 Tax=Tanacetum coccineum TaxID=301880 RepID=A0ABQ4YDK5_9ASTR
MREFDHWIDECEQRGDNDDEDRDKNFQESVHGYPQLQTAQAQLFKSRPRLDLTWSNCCGYDPKDTTRSGDIRDLTDEEAIYRIRPSCYVSVQYRFLIQKRKADAALCRMDDEKAWDKGTRCGELLSLQRHLTYLGKIRTALKELRLSVSWRGNSIQLQPWRTNPLSLIVSLSEQVPVNTYTAKVSWRDLGLTGTDISEITRKPSKTGKHEHENGRVYKSRKPKPEKVKSSVQPIHLKQQKFN